MIAEMDKTNSSSLQVSAEPEDGYHVGWQCPSNIALVKYWGKTGNQVPMNPSLSMTLDASVTKTLVRTRKKENSKDAAQLKYIFEGSENLAFHEKILVVLNNLSDELPFLKDYNLEVESSNTFPHSAGIASSASSMGALALCLLSLDALITGKKLNIHTFLKKASHIARLGSGSASRSLYGDFVLWGKLSMIPKSVNLSAIPLPVKPHPVFANLQDSILVIDQSEKPVSSRAGHEKMYSHPFRKGRILQADKNIRQIIKALGTGDWNTFSNAVENEALTLHGLMMSSEPGILLIQPNSLRAIEKIKAFRTRKNIKITFTLDAGPNLHLLYPEEDSKAVRKFISQDLAEFCVNNYVIYDQIGRGPVQII